MAGIYTDVRKAVRRAAIQSLIEYFPDTASQNAGIIFSHVNGSEPVNPYVVINILGHSQQGHVQTASTTNEQFELIHQVAYEVTVQFSFCGSTAGDMAHSFSQRVNNSVLSLDATRKEKLGVLRKSDIRRAPQKRDTQWVEYFNQDVVFSYIIRTTQAVDWIESVILENQIIDPSETFTVPPGIPIP